MKRTAITVAIGAVATTMIAACGGGDGGGGIIIPPSPGRTDFVQFVHKLFANTSDATQPEDINDLDFSNLDADPGAFDDLLK
jgi:hypothetical protein